MFKCMHNLRRTFDVTLFLHKWQDVTRAFDNRSTHYRFEQLLVQCTWTAKQRRQEKLPKSDIFLWASPSVPLITTLLALTIPLNFRPPPFHDKQIIACLWLHKSMALNYITKMSLSFLRWQGCQKCSYKISYKNKSTHKDNLSTIHSSLQWYRT